MDFWSEPMNVLTFTTWFLTLIFDANELLIAVTQVQPEDEPEPLALMRRLFNDSSILDTLAMMATTLHNYRLCCPAMPLSEDLGYWVKLRSTTWFSRFLVQQYDDSLWLSMFRMTKASVFSLADILKPHVEKKNTKYRLAIHVLIGVAVTLFKLYHGANLTVCSEMFAIGRSTVCKVLREVVHAINDSMKNEVTWPSTEKLRHSQAKFVEMCSLPAVVGAIDGMHVGIAKPDFCPADYYYFKTGGYRMNCQAVVDADKRFLDLYIGMPGSTNDSRMLRRPTLHSLASEGQLFDPALSVDEHSPYLIGDLGYPLLPWLMVPHRGGRRHSVSEVLFNKKLRSRWCVVENAFGILKQCFRELLLKSDLHLAFLPDVIICCAILHNILLGQSPADVEHLLSVLRSEGLDHDVPNEPPYPANRTADVLEDVGIEAGTQKR